jgi:DNA-binding NtrC family response regulator
VFLDEVGEMSLRMQALLLRFLECGEIQRVGSERARITVDVRSIAATNRQLQERICRGAFREDLFYRLNVVHFAIPPLRERRDDIPPLVDYLLQRHAESSPAGLLQVAPEAMTWLVAHEWRGNVRELRNVVERAVVRAGGSGVIQLEHVAQELRGGRPAVLDRAVDDPVRSRVDELYERITTGGESFWSVVYEPFMQRDVRRDDLRTIVARGLEQTCGSYKVLMELYNMNSGDYRRFLSFLRKYDCHVPFQPFRVVRPVETRVDRLGAA